jgi:hypothetical protein
MKKGAVIPGKAGIQCNVILAKPVPAKSGSGNPEWKVLSNDLAWLDARPEPYLGTGPACAGMMNYDPTSTGKD